MGLNGCHWARDGPKSSLAPFQSLLWNPNHIPVFTHTPDMLQVVLSWTQVLHGWTQVQSAQLQLTAQRSYIMS